MTDEKNQSKQRVLSLRGRLEETSSKIAAERAAQRKRVGTTEEERSAFFRLAMMAKLGTTAQESAKAEEKLAQAVFGQQQIDQLEACHSATHQELIAAESDHNKAAQRCACLQKKLGESITKRNVIRDQWAVAVKRAKELETELAKSENGVEMLLRAFWSMKSNENKQ